MEDNEQSVGAELVTETTPVVSADEPSEDVLEGSLTDEDSESTDESAPEDEDEDVEHNGKLYKIPKGLTIGQKEEFLMQQDYTKKTQEIAESRRAFENEQQSFQLKAQFQNAHLSEIVKAQNLEDQLAKYQNIDWDALDDQDPIQAQKLDRQFNRLKEEYRITQGNIQQAQQQFTLLTQQETARRLEQSKAVVTSELKDWTPEVGKQVGEYLKTYSKAGVNDTVLQEINNGVYGALPIILARKAQLYEQLMNKNAVKKTAPPPPPVTKVGAKTTVSKDPINMTPAQYAEYRRKVIAARRT